MNDLAHKLRVWTPRGLLILFALFLTLFSLDVFNDDHSLGQTALALLMHNLPTLFLLATVAAAWRREWIGAVVGFSLGVLYIVLAWGRFPMLTYVIISGPLFLIGGLYFASWIARVRSRRAAAETAAGS